MGVSLRILPAIARLDKMLADVAPKQRAEFSNIVLTRVVLHLVAEVTTSGDFIKHGRGDADPLPNVLTNRHGGQGLVGSIGPDYSQLPRLMSLGSDLPYSGVHEGEEGRGQRPYLNPTWEKSRKTGKLTKIASAALDGVLTKAGFR